MFGLNYILGNMKCKKMYTLLLFRILSAAFGLENDSMLKYLYKVEIVGTMMDGTPLRCFYCSLSGSHLCNESVSPLRIKIIQVLLQEQSHKQHVHVCATNLSLIFSFHR